MARRSRSKPVPIIEAKTIAEFVAAVNAEYGLNIPESWPDGSELAKVWALAVSVAQDPDGYTATAKTAYPEIGLAGADFAGRLSATVASKSRFYLRNAIGDEQLDLETLNHLQKEA